MVTALTRSVQTDLPLKQEWDEMADEGMILQDETIKYTFDRNLRSYEFLGTDEPYKLKWTKDCHELVAWRAFSRGPGGRAAWFGRAVARPMARKLKKRATPDSS